MSPSNHRRLRYLARSAPIMALAAALTFDAGSTFAAAAVTPTSISQVPLTVTIPAHPQVILALGNSQSMDGDLSGAILTGSGGLGAGFAGLNASSSPTNYTVPAGFTAPLTLTAAGGAAPYTVTTAGVQYDNSASRLNVAKAGITSILNNFLADADFALMDYQTGGLTEYTTWVYYMSQPGGFTFTNSPAAGVEFVPNPCYNVNQDSANTVDSACQTLSSRYPSIKSYADMLVSASSDDPDVSDVLYAPANFGSSVFVTYGGPNPLNPFTTYNLGEYETTFQTNAIEECYNQSLPNVGGICETPTNAGFVPYSAEVMNSERGFGYFTTSETSAPSSNSSWPPLVPMTSAGAAPTQASVNTAVAAFTTAALAPESNSTGTAEIKAQATNSPIAGLLVAAQDYYSSQNPVSTNGCAAHRYVVLVTDGLPTMDLAGHTWPPLGSAAATGYGENATFNADGTVGTTNDQALTDTINTLTALNTAGIKTYIIALGSGIDPTTVAGSTMTAMAIAGGTGAYFSAQNVATLDADMQAILVQILSATQSTSTAAVNSTGVHNGSVAYQAQFTSSDTNQDWTGTLTAYPIDPTTGDVLTTTVPPIWNPSAQAQLDSQTAGTRIIATWDPVAGAGVPFEWSAGTPTSGIATSTVLGQDLETNTTDPNGQHALNYLRGDRSLEKAHGGPYRTRTHLLGDIIDSSPIYVGAPNGPSLAGSYFTFEQTFATRPPVLYVGANDGMLHAFDATTGAERFAFIPNGVYANLIQLTNPYYNEQHRFYVDGSPEASDVQFGDGSWHTVLVGGENAGGNSIYALDVTDPASIINESSLASKVLWEFTDANMGATFSTPQLALTNAGSAAFFGNGYDSPTQTPYVYALNPQTGAVLAKINLCAAVATSPCNAAVANGLSTVTLTNASGDATAPATELYAGDLQGNLWRVDISSTVPTSWTVSVLLQATDPTTGAAQPITTAPAVTLNPGFPRVPGTMVYVGTGEMLGVPDLSSTQVQTLYGVYDSGIPGAILKRTNSALVQQTMGTIAGTTLRDITSTSLVTIPPQLGWYVDFNLLPGSGERIVTDPEIDSGAVIVTSNVPGVSTTCTATEASWLNEFNYATGGSFAVPQFDTTGMGNLNSSVIASGMYLGAVFSASPRIRTGSFGTNANRVKLITESSGAIQSVIERGPSQQRTAWWEIR